MPCAKLGFDFAVGVLPTLGVVRLRQTRIESTPSAESVAEVIAAGPEKRVSSPHMAQRHPSRTALSRFCFVRVKTTARRRHCALAEREPLWLVAEWPDNESKPTKFVLTTLPRRMSHKSTSSASSRSDGEPNVCTKTSRANSGVDHFEGRSFAQVGTTIACRVSVVLEGLRVATPSWSLNASALFPPRPPGRVATVRSKSRPERHFKDSFITARLAIALYLARWLPRCPICQQPHVPSRCSVRRFTTLS